MSKLETNTIDTVSGTTNLTIGGANNTGSTTIKTNNTDAVTIDNSQNLKFNSGYGSVQTAYGVRVWLRYDQVNNVVEASGGVSSVTDAATGEYIINFTNNMPDADYAVAGWSGRNANPIVAGQSNDHNVGSIRINTGDAINGVWTVADVDDSTVIIVK